VGLRIEWLGGRSVCVSRGVCVGADGSVVVADFGNHRVQVFDCQGVFVRAFGSAGWGPVQFTLLHDVCMLPGGQILATDYMCDDAQVFSWEGVYVRSIGKEGDSRVELDHPTGAAVDSKGRVFVACEGSERVRMLLRVGA